MLCVLDILDTNQSTYSVVAGTPTSSNAKRHPFFQVPVLVKNFEYLQMCDVIIYFVKHTIDAERKDIQTGG